MNSAELREAFNPTVNYYEDVGAVAEQLALQRIPTGSLGLDIALGGGWPVGYTSEISGPPAIGTSTLALHGIAAAQKAFPDQIVMLYDTMGDFSPSYATACGIDLKRLYLSQLPVKVPQETVSLSVVDPLTGHWWNTGQQTSLIITQLRTVLSGPYSDTGTVRTGMVDADVRVKLNVKKLVHGGILVHATVVHDSLNPGAGRVPAEYKIRYGQGIDSNDELLRLALKYGVVWKQHNRYYFNNDGYRASTDNNLLGHGWRNAVQSLELYARHLIVESDVRRTAGI